MDGKNPDLTLGELGENALVRRLVHGLPSGDTVLVGPGDDCAVVAGGDGLDLLLKADAVVEGIHFESAERPSRVGAKALNRALSDIAAMGGTPRHALVTIAFPSSTQAGVLEGIYEGIAGAARPASVAIVGGETVGLPEGAPGMISVSLLGDLPAGSSVLRSGARPGHLLCVTGVLGGSLASGWHLDFEPRLSEGRWLRESGSASAMMDLSDGLSADLPRLAEASGCGFRIEREALPLRAGCTIEEALGDGEDYELLFTVPQEKLEQLLANWPFEIPLTRIGEIVEEGKGERLGPGGWEHFR